MTVMSEVRTRSAYNEQYYKPTVFLRTIWRRTLSFKRRKSEDRFAGYKGVRDITIKKGPSGLGIMIIEGRHTEAGRGIFVSDLQEGSAAEQAGLQIGDMLLAVNRDSLLNCSYDAAAGKLKHTEGVVVLTVCSPNMREEGDEPPAAGATPAASRPASRNQTPDPALGAGSSRPQTPRPTPSPVKVDPPADPATAPVVPNQDTTIEISSNCEVLGLLLLGGCDTYINAGPAVILDIYKGGAIDKDGRLHPGDCVKECNGITLTPNMTYERVCLTIKQKTPKLRLVVHRASPLQYSRVEVELARKPPRALGLACVPRVHPAEPRVYLGDLLAGSPAALDGRLQRGDLVVSVEGRDLTTSTALDAAAALKMCATSAKVRITVDRYKPVT